MTDESTYIANAGVQREKYRPYRDWSDDRIAAMIAEYREWLDDPFGRGKIYPALIVREIESEIRAREMERSV